MRKFIVAVIVLFVLVAVGYFITINSPGSKETPENSRANNNLEESRPDPSNATFIFDDGSVTLSAGKGVTPVISGSSLVEETVILDKFGFGDLNADGKDDTALFLARYGAGSGTFIYLGVYVSGPVTYRGSNVIFIGDRISPQAISIKDGVISVDYLGRAFDEPFNAEPTIPVTQYYVYRNGKLQER